MRGIKPRMKNAQLDCCHTIFYSSEEGYRVKSSHFYRKDKNENLLPNIKLCGFSIIT